MRRAVLAYPDVTKRAFVLRQYSPEDATVDLRISRVSGDRPAHPALDRDHSRTMLDAICATASSGPAYGKRQRAPSTLAMHPHALPYFVT